MPIVEPLSARMIEKYLRSTSWRYLVDRDGDYLLQFAHSDDWGCDLEMYLTLSGPRGDVLSMHATPGYRIPAGRWTDALLACNEWNIDKRYPKAAFRAGTAKDNAGRFFVQLALDCEKGIHQELLGDTIVLFIAGADSFCRWAHESKGFGRDGQTGDAGLGTVP
jgi:hypothetical protein